MISIFGVSLNDTWEKGNYPPLQHLVTKRNSPDSYARDIPTRLDPVRHMFLLVCPILFWVNVWPPYGLLAWYKHSVLHQSLFCEWFAPLWIRLLQLQDLVVGGPIVKDYSVNFCATECFFNSSLTASFVCPPLGDSKFNSQIAPQVQVPHLRAKGWGPVSKTLWQY